MKRVRPLLQKLSLLVLLSVLLYLLRFVVEAIAEKEIQDWWTGSAIPVLGSKVEIQLWILCLSITLLIAIALLVYWLVRQTPRIKEGKPNPDRMRSPMTIEDRGESGYGYDNVDVIKAYKKAQKGELPINVFATIIEQSVNSGSLQPHVGAELLERFRYELMIRSDERWEAREERRSR